MQVQQCFVHGHSLKPNLVAVAVPDPEVVVPWAKKRGLPVDMEALCRLVASLSEIECQVSYITARVSQITAPLKKAAVRITAIVSKKQPSFLRAPPASCFTQQSNPALSTWGAARLQERDGDRGCAARDAAGGQCS